MSAGDGGGRAPVAAEYAEKSAHANGVTLRYIEAGRGPLVLMLHGFPDSPHTWRFQMPALAAAGHHVVAPALRGYGRSDRPNGVSAYDIEQIEADVAALAASLGAPRLHALVGHDWGGVIAWRVAARNPSLVERLVVVNAPHPTAFARELRGPSQIARSSYAALFQIPFLPEAALRLGGLRLVRATIERMVHRRGAFTDADWLHIRQTLEEPGALEGALNYYRAAAWRVLRNESGAAGELPRIDQPTLLLWGERDPALSVELTLGLEPYVPKIVVKRFPDSGHWVHWDEPNTVAREMAAHLAR